MPDHAGARALLGAFGGPVVAPSANRSGYVSATTARHVAEDLGAAVSVILDGGQTGIGIESTVLDCTGETVRILRPGAITRTALRACLGEGLSEDADTGGKVLAPGMLASHYAPNALVRLAAAEIAEGEAALTFGTARPAGLEHAVAVRNLSRDADLEEAAANLFTALRDLDASGARRIAVSPIPDTGIGAAINDRLRRAAAPRDIPGA